MTRNPTRPRVVLTTTWPRSANAFYGPVIDQFQTFGVSAPERSLILISVQ